LEGLPLLERAPSSQGFDSSQLTAKEALLLEYLLSRPDEVCTKDELVRAVWPEDQIYEQGIRDDSLAQLVRRLRVKVEPDPSNPTHIYTIPGRGYQYKSN
jgi:two-component system response regulator RegX3